MTFDFAGKIIHEHFVEHRHRLDSFTLNRIGLFQKGAVATLRWDDDGGHLLARQSANILVDDNPVEVVWDTQARPFFKCGRCGGRVKHVYFDSDGLACRDCLRLLYSSRHLYRSVSDRACAKITRLRRRMGAPLELFAPIPRKKPCCVAYWRTAQRLLAEEKRLVELLRRKRYR